MANVDPFSDEQARTLLDLEQQYSVWMAAEQTLAALPYDLRRKDVAGRIYLYEIHDRTGNGRSLGPWSEENEAKFTAYREAKAAAKARREASGRGLQGDQGRGPSLSGHTKIQTRSRRILPECIQALALR